MTDDPTTTGDEVIEFVRAARHIRTVPGGKVVERTTFALDFKCDLIFTVADEALTISFETVVNSQPYKVSFPPLALNTFETSADLNIYLDSIKQNFLTLLQPRLAQEAVSTLQVLMLGIYGMMNPGAVDRARIIEGYTEQGIEHLNTMLAQLPERQKPGTWSKIGLRNAVADAAFRLIQRGVKGRALTLDATYEEMREQFKEHTPASGEALRKQLEDRGLNWRVIKAEVERYAEAEAESPLPPPVSSEIH
jgi:hypothetical protein